MREPLRPPGGDLNRQIPYIEIRHPAYPKSEPPLLRLAALEADNHDVAGLDYDVAWLACGIITGNTWTTGYLATQTCAGNFEKVDRAPDGMLRDAEYFYFVYDHPPDYRYNVIISFDHWRFPHGDLPTIFQQTVIPPGPNLPSLRGKAAALARDVTCRITGDDTPVEAAHFVPDASKQWFLSNQMNRYSSSEPDPTSDVRNLISLRRDLHYLFDARRFTFVPRMRGNKGRMELYVFCPNSHVRLVSRYHNLPPQPLSGISMECVLARFAWTIFSPAIMPFFQGMAEYAVRVFNLDSGQWEDENLRGPDIRMKLNLFDRFLQSRGTVRKRKCSEHVETEYFEPQFDSDLGNSSPNTLSGRNTFTSNFSSSTPMGFPGTEESGQSTETELYVHPIRASSQVTDTMMARTFPIKRGTSADHQASSKPFNIACDVMTLATSTLSSTKSLTARIRNLRGHNNRTLALRRELSDLTTVLEVLLTTIATNCDTDFDYLKSPLHRCGNACNEFGELISSFTMRSTGEEKSIADWSRQKYLQGDITDFKDLLACYKSTISIAIASINLRVAAVTPTALEDYKSLVSDTTQDLKHHLQDIGDRTQRLSREQTMAGCRGNDEWPAIEEEKKFTKHGLEIGAQLSAQIEQFESIAVVDTKSFGSPEAQRFVTTGLEVTKASIHSMVSRLRHHENVIKGRFWRMIPSKQWDDKTTEQLERLQATKDSLDKCLQLISDAGDDSSIQQYIRVISEADRGSAESERQIEFEERGLAENSSFIVSTAGDLVTARRINLNGASYNVGGRITAQGFPKAVTAFSEDELLHSNDSDDLSTWRPTPTAAEGDRRPTDCSG